MVRAKRSRLTDDKSSYIRKSVANAETQNTLRNGGVCDKIQLYATINRGDSTIRMIYLIGGAPRCGKTTIAQQLSKRLRVPWISADTLESIVTEYFSDEELDQCLPKRRMRVQTKHSNDLMYSTFTAKQIVNAYRKQAKATQKAIEMLVLVQEQEGQDYIIEGYQVHPALMKKLIKKYGAHHVRAMVVTRFDVEGIVKGCLSHKAKSDWFTQKTKDPATYPKIATMIAQYSRTFEREAKKLGIQTINMDQNFNEQVKEAVRRLAG